MIVVDPIFHLHHMRTTRRTLIRKLNIHTHFSLLLFLCGPTCFKARIGLPIEDRILRKVIEMVSRTIELSADNVPALIRREAVIPTCTELTLLGSTTIT